MPTHNIIGWVWPRCSIAVHGLAEDALVVRRRGQRVLVKQNVPPPVHLKQERVFVVAEAFEPLAAHIRRAVRRRIQRSRQVTLCLPGPG